MAGKVVWFVVLWTAGVIAVGALAYGIRFMVS